MKINHAALYVSDLESVRAFYEKYFGGVSNEKYHNQSTGLQTYFLTFDGNCRLELMYSPQALSADRSVTKTGYAHLAFSAGGRGAVDELTARLEADGYHVLSQPRVTGDGYYESTVLDTEGNIIEITE